MIIECGADEHCASGAECVSNICFCPTSAPILLGQSAAFLNASCVPCTASDRGSCSQF